MARFIYCRRLQEKLFTKDNFSINFIRPFGAGMDNLSVFVKREAVLLSKLPPEKYMKRRLMSPFSIWLGVLITKVWYYQRPTGNYGLPPENLPLNLFSWATWGADQSLFIIQALSPPVMRMS